MMHERIYLGGAPVVGFGANSDPLAESAEPYKMALARERAAAPWLIAGFFVGAAGGAVLGNVIHKGAVGAAVGTVVGGISGAVSSSLLAMYMNKSPATTKNCDLESISAEERKAIFDKVTANLAAAGTPFDASFWSDEKKYAAFMSEVYKVTGCSMPTASKP